MSDIQPEDDEVLLTTKRQKIKKFAIDSDSEENFSSLLAKPTKTEKESLERKEFPHNSAKKPQKSQNIKEKSQISQENPSFVQASPQNKREDRFSSNFPLNGDKDRDKEPPKKDFKESERENRENIEKNKQKSQKPAETPKKKEPMKEKSAVNPKKKQQKTYSFPPKSTKTKQPDSELSLFNPESSSEEERKPGKYETSEENEKKHEFGDMLPSKKQQKALLLKPKDSVIKGILRRWWYCMDEWPPKNYDYAGKLKEKGFRQVEFAKWKAEPEKDELGLEKVYQIEGFQGIFKNSKGVIMDLRPKESCPCFDTLKKKSFEELMGLYKTALTNQIKALEEFTEYESPELLAELRKELNKVQKINNSSGFS